MVVFSLTLIRHGETLANRENIIQGQSDVPLSDVGIQQARLVGVRLQNERLTHVFASDLLRAAQTAQAIVEANKVYVNAVIKDKRLRERKFGVVEGKTFKELAAEARRNNSSIPNFTPYGAENIEQVRIRAKSFFHDLLTLLKNNAHEDGNYIPASIKRRADHSSSHSSDRVHCFQAVTRQTSQENNLNLDVGDKILTVSKRPRHDDQEVVNGLNQEFFPLDLAQSDKILSQTDKVFDESQHLDMPQTAIARSNSSSSSGCSSLPESAESQEQASELSTPTEEEQKDFDPHDVQSSSPVALDTEIKSNIRSSRSDAFGCPNVSLSPLLEHRLSSISSISSGRNNSFDDADGIPPSIADVIVVSHGGFLKELIRHFVEDLKCKMPGGKGYALRVGPNASVSKFTITIDDITDNPIITCLLIHDKEHLLPLDISQAPGTF
ncbi:uncharacterized protein [Haliotis asinina]|uniref:uncharacterized protein n=1 Tax=Haliotis asinina TaxID=109174 RepID=UPI003531973A